MRHLIFLLVLSPLAAQQPVQVSPVDQRIANARKQVELNPKVAQGYNDLAFALCRKARDSGDSALYDQALAATDKSSQLTPADYDAGKLRVTALMGKHEYPQALKLAIEMNKKVPDDIGNWALLADLNAALGNYTEAERCAQWVLDLRRGSALGFETAAKLREVFGDFDGALEYQEEALRRTSQNDVDQRAWLILQRAHLFVAKGDAKSAAITLAEVHGLFPDSQMALGVEAEIDTAQGNFAHAATLLEKRYQSVPTASHLYAWAQALESAGQTDQAAAQFKLFETKARAEVTKPLNANLDLVAYYDDHKKTSAEGLALATKEAALRQDYATLDALAWSLYLNGKTAEAKQAMDKALAVGVRNPVYFCHAARIAGKTCTADQPMAASLGVSK